MIWSKKNKNKYQLGDRIAVEVKKADLIKKHLDFTLNLEKFRNSLNSINFNKLKKIENEKGFEEKSRKTNSFFRKGETKEWEKILNIDLIKKINENFKKEMIYLNYI